MKKNEKIATSLDVAQLAGVSQSAVSRCFTKGASISSRTKLRVLEAAKKLKYKAPYIPTNANSNDDIGISSEDWIDGNFFWIVDLNVDKCCNYHDHKSQPGTINLKMQTKTNLSKTARLIVYSSSRQSMTIDYKTGKVLSSI